MNTINNQLEFINNLTKELTDTNSSNAKVEILKKFSQINEELFIKWMQHIYDFDVNYWMTSDNLIKKENEPHTVYEFDLNKSIFEVLGKIINRELTGHSALNYINDLINLFPNYKDMIYKIINRDLKVNVGVALVNKARPFTIKVFSVALAETEHDANDSNQHKIDFEKINYSVMQKLDGCRCIIMHTDKGIFYYSRQGKTFESLEKLNDDVIKLDIKNKYVVDGEVCIIDETGHENFQAIMKEITRKNHIISCPTLVAFDLIPIEEFIATKGESIYNIRFNNLKLLLEEKKLNNIRLIKHKLNATKNDFEEYKELAKKNNWEGLMLRDQNSQYEGKRTYNLIKCKVFYDSEYIVEDIEVGTKPFLENGLMVEKECVGALIIKHKGYKVNVGSGLSNQQRIDWFNNPKLIIGKEITVQYFEETTDDKGDLSLRFPTLKFVYENGREI